VTIRVWRQTLINVSSFGEPPLVNLLPASGGFF